MPIIIVNKDEENLPIKRLRRWDCTQKYNLITCVCNRHTQLKIDLLKLKEDRQKCTLKIKIVIEDSSS